MQYVYNPQNGRINPVMDVTLNDPLLRNKVISEKLYNLVCQGKVKIEHIAAQFAVGKSPEILIKNVRAVEDSPAVTAPNVVPQLPSEEKAPAANDMPQEHDVETVSAADAFDGRDLVNKKLPELIMIAKIVGIDVNDPNTPTTRQGLIKAICAKAKEGVGDVKE